MLSLEGSGILRPYNKCQIVYIIIPHSNPILNSGICIRHCESLYISEHTGITRNIREIHLAFFSTRKNKNRIARVAKVSRNTMSHLSRAKESVCIIARDYTALDYM